MGGGGGVVRGQQQQHYFGEMSLRGAVSFLSLRPGQTRAPRGVGCGGCSKRWSPPMGTCIGGPGVYCYTIHVNVCSPNVSLIHVIIILYIGHFHSTSISSYVSARSITSVPILLQDTRKIIYNNYVCTLSN